MRKIKVTGRFSCKKWDFGFVIPEDRADWGGDFFVSQKHFNGARDGDSVEAMVLETTTGRKPEVKIMKILSGKWLKAERPTIKTVEWVFSGGSGDFGFVDVPGDTGYFCYGLKRNGAMDGDTVRAEIKKFNGKDEAIVVEILSTDAQVFEGVYSDNESFGFVKVSGESQDIFIPGGKSLEAQNWAKVEGKIVKQGGRRPEGIITKIL